MKARELMTQEPTCCTPEDTIQQAAQLMRDHDCGCIPVVADAQSKRLVGVVTDRDNTLRSTAEGKGPQTRVKDVLSPNPTSCGPDDEVEAVERIMVGERVRRVPVVDRGGACVGMIAQADLALNHQAASESEVGKMVERISEPALAPS